MTRTQRIVMLIEAVGPLSFTTLRQAMQEPAKALGLAVARLLAWGVLRVVNYDGRRCYAMA